jgi:tripartite-type tricarboxylate transporter receptor subunit TctC
LEGEEVMKKLDAIRKIVESDKVSETTKLTGIKQVLAEDEDIAETIAATYTKSSEQIMGEQSGKRLG